MSDKGLRIRRPGVPLQAHQQFRHLQEIVSAALFARNLPKIKEKVRPICVKMGIIMEVADGMEAAAEQPPLPDSHG